LKTLELDAKDYETTNCTYQIGFKKLIKPIISEYFLKLQTILKQLNSLHYSKIVSAYVYLNDAKLQSP
jgi:hypothetical protein